MCGYIADNATAPNKIRIFEGNRLVIDGTKNIQKEILKRPHQV